MEPKDLLQKADLAISEITDNGGYLKPEQTTSFIEVINDQPTLLQAIRTVDFTTPDYELSKVGFGERILRKAPAEGTALAANKRAKPSFGSVKLNTKEFIAEVWMPYRAFEDTIERGTFEQTLLRMMGERVTLDLQDYAINGDTAHEDDEDLTIWDGYLKLCSEHILDAAGPPAFPIGSGLFNAALKLMPPKYRANKNLLKFLCHPDIEQDYREKIAQRQTVLGDTAVQGINGNVRAHGVELVPTAYMPAGDVLLTNPQNLILGIQRRFLLKKMDMISERQIKFVMTLRADVNVEETKSVVKVTGVPNL
jgi:hypothetical protein